MKKKRIFIAIFVSEAIKNKIIKLQDKLRDWDNVRWEINEKMHITLHFLGYLNAIQIKAVKDALSRIKFSKFKAGIGEYCFFPYKKRPRVICLNIKSGDKIEKLQDMIGNELRRYRFFKPEKRKFHAHLTFGRVKKISQKQVEVIEKEKISGFWIVDRVDLMESVLRGKRGSVYRILDSYRLN